MNEISQSNCLWNCATEHVYPGKHTITKMHLFERWKYIEEGKKNGTLEEYSTGVKSVWGSEIYVYYDKVLNTYSEIHPWTGSAWFDITKDDFLKYENRKLNK